MELFCEQFKAVILKAVFDGVVHIMASGNILASGNISLKLYDAFRNNRTTYLLIRRG